MRLHGISRESVGAAAPASPAVEERAPAPLPPARGEPATPVEAHPDPAGSEPASGALDEPVVPPPASAPTWEQKPVAIVAVSLAWPEHDDGTRAHEPWTAHQRWAGLVREKLSGLGGVTIQDSPSLSVWAFGVPTAVDQLMERAVHGALSIRQMVDALSARERAPELRLAVHHGAMLVDAAAPEPARGALAVGDTLALPIRLLGEAAAGEIVVSAELGDRVAAWARVDRRDAGEGARDRGAYRIEGLRPWRERGSSRSLTPFVGRERELSTLSDLMAAAERGAGQIAGIVGPPGSGKSRLLRELRRRLAGRGIIGSEAHALAHGATTPFLPFAEMARSYLDVTEFDPPEVVRERARAGLEAVGLDPEADGSYLVALLGGARPEGVDGEALRRRTFDLIRRIMLALTEQAPVLLTIENAHWLDPSSEACVAGLAEHLAGARCLLVVTYRPGYRPDWLDRSYATQIALPPLTAADSRRMIGAVAGRREVPAELADQVLTWAEGNPLFIEELTRSVLEDGAITSAAVPATVHAAIGARIERLPAGDRRLLQLAAVIGREIPHDVLERAADLAPHALHDGLARLQAAELLVERGSRAVRTFGFTHALTQAAAYQGVPAATREALHLRILDALLALGAGDRPESLPALAAHATAAGQWRRALSFHRAAGLRLLAREAHQEAARCLEEALAALAQFDPPAEPDDLRLAFDLRIETIQAVYRLGKLARHAELAHEALEIAERLGDAARLVEVLATVTHMRSNEGRHAEALETGARALALAKTHGITHMQVWTGIMVGRTCHALGRFAEGIEHLRSVVRTIGVDGDQRFALRGVMPPSPSARSYLALCLSRTGELDEAVRHAEEAVRVAETSSGPMDRAWSYYALGRAHHARTDWERAIPLLERAATLSEREGHAPYLPRMLAGLASAHAQSGNTAEAVPLLERALAAGRAIRFAYGESLILCQLGTTCVESGRVDEAQRYASQALSLARERGERAEEAWALLLFGDVAARREPPAVDEARSWYAQAIALGEELGMRPHVARARLALGALERRAGRVEEARGHLAEAAAAAEAMGITAWQARAAELAG